MKWINLNDQLFCFYCPLESSSMDVCNRGEIPANIEVAVLWWIGFNISSSFITTFQREMFFGLLIRLFFFPFNFNPPPLPCKSNLCLFLEFLKIQTIMRKANIINLIIPDRDDRQFLTFWFRLFYLPLLYYTKFYLPTPCYHVIHFDFYLAFSSFNILWISILMNILIII